MFQVVLDVSDSILQDETVRRSLIPRTSNRWYNWVKKHHNCRESCCLWFSWKLLKLLYCRVSHKSRRIAKILNMTFHINLPSFSSLSRSGIIFTFKKRASFMGNPVLINLLTVYQTVIKVICFPNKRLCGWSYIEDYLFKLSLSICREIINSRVTPDTNGPNHNSKTKPTRTKLFIIFSKALFVLHLAISKIKLWLGNC